MFRLQYRQPRRLTIQQLGEATEDRRTTIGLHPSKVASGIEITNSQLYVNVPNDRGGNQESREYNRHNQEGGEESCYGAIDLLQAASQLDVDRLDIFRETVQ